MENANELGTLGDIFSYRSYAREQEAIVKNIPQKDDISSRVFTGKKRILYTIKEAKFENFQSE